MKSLKNCALLLTALSLSPHLSASLQYKQEPCIPVPSLVKTAEELMDWKMYGAAIPAYTHAIQQLQPLHGQLRTSLTLRLGQMHLLLGQSEKVIELLNTIPIGPGHSEAIKIKALSYIYANQPEAAISLLDPAEMDHILLYAMAHESTGAHDLAADYLRKIPSASKAYPFAKLLLAKIALAKGAYSLAFEELSFAPTDHFLYPEILWMMGMTHYLSDNIPESIVYFEKALALPGLQSHSWHTRCIEQLSHTYLRQCSEMNWTAGCNSEQRTLEEKKCLLSRAEELLQKELKRQPDDRLTLALVKVYLTKNFYFFSHETLRKCEELLTKENGLSTKAAQTEGLLLRAQMVSTYLEREEHLRMLTTAPYEKNSAALPYGWFLRGHNEREQAYRGTPQERRRHLELAINYYKNAYHLFKKFSLPLSFEALRNWAQIAHDLQEVHQLNAVRLIISQAPKGEACYLRSLITTHLYDLTGNTAYLQEAVDTLQQGLKENPSDKERVQLSLLLGKLYFLKNAFSEAEALLAELPSALPSASMAAEALYWCGRAAEKNPSARNTSHYYYQKCYADYPTSAFAAEAFFRRYSYQEYLHGDKEAKKHLEELLVSYPDSPYTMDALFLLGLDSKRDRKTAKGKWISKSNMTKAIDQFQQVSSDYQRLKKLNQIPESSLEHYFFLELRASLEKALCNLAIARQSLGAKKHIYLQYAEEVFTDLIGSMTDKSQNERLQDILEEAMYGLAQTHLEAEHYDDAEEMLQQIIRTYESLKITRGYYLSRSWHDLSLIALARIPADRQADPEEKRYTEALDYLMRAEECSKGRVLSTNQTIDLWLKMSHCYKMMQQYDQAMRYLTKAIDEDAISALRLKAMYLRAEIYELQGRYELSRKQLEAAAKKGGEWGKKAKEKLEELYGYH